MPSRPLAIGLTWTSAASIASLLLQLLQLAVLARYLEGRDFGAVAIGMVFVGLAQAFADVGLTSAIFHRREITPAQLAALYWINLVGGVVMFLLLVGVAPIVAAFYDEPELVKIQASLAVTFLLMPIGQQFQTLLQRDFHFDLLAGIEVGARAAGVAVACLLAVTGEGPYALVGGALVNTGVAAGCYFAIGMRRYQPRFAADWREAKSFVSFGLYQMGDRLLSYVNAEFDTLLIGRLLGTEVLGGYSVAKQLALRPAQLLNPIVTRVLLPHLSALGGDARRRAMYLSGINLLVSANFPIYVALFTFAEPITAVLFGEQWGHVAPLLQALSVWGLVRSTGNPAGVLLLSRGRVDLSFKWNLALFTVIPTIIYIGSHWGAPGVASALAALQLALLVPSWRFVILPMCGAGFGEYHRVILRVFPLASAAGAIGWLAALLPAGALAKVVVGIVVLTGVYAVLIALFNRSVLAALQEAS